MTELNIIPECFVDTKVAEIVGMASRKYNHQHGCGDVANRMMRLKDEICLGIIDEDKNKGPRAKYFGEFRTCNNENNLILQRHNSRNQYLILICPEIEKWLFNDAKNVKVDPEEFGLPLELKGFISKSKTQDIDRNEGFKRFIKTLINQKAPSISTLKCWIEQFKTGEMVKLYP